MKLGGLVTGLAVTLTGFAGSVGFAATVDFESVPQGTVYGGAFGHTPGDVVLTQEGIEMSVEKFFLGTFVGFVKAEVGGVYSDFFPTAPLGIDNISVSFDLSDVGFDVTQVTLDYQEFGGADNFAVNGHTLYQLNVLTDIPTGVAPGVTASAGAGVITLTGDIDCFRIGGQELAIDNIVAVPEPTGVLLLGLAGALAFRRRSRRAR